MMRFFLLEKEKIFCFRRNERGRDPPPTTASVQLLFTYYFIRVGPGDPMMGAGNGIGWGENCVHLSPAHTGDFSTAQLPRISIFLGDAFGGFVLVVRRVVLAMQDRKKSVVGHAFGQEEKRNESPVERTGRERRS
jgi:hypothetical protein